MYNIKNDNDLDNFLEYWKDIDKFFMYPINSTFDDIKRTEIRIVLPKNCDDEYQFFQEVISKFILSFNEKLNNGNKQ